MGDLIFGDETGEVLLAEGCAALDGLDLREREEAELLGVSVEDGGIDVAQVGFGVEKIVAEDNRAEVLNGGGEFFVGAGFRGEILEFSGESRVHLLDAFFSGLQSFLKRLDGCGADFGLAKGDVEGRDRSAVGVQDVEEVGEIGTREGPAAENLLRMLVDIHDHDSRIYGSGVARAVTESRVQRIVFKALKEREDRCGALAKKRKVIERR